MRRVIGSITNSGLGGVLGVGAGASSSPAGFGGFGPAFLYSAISTRLVTSGSAYDASGRPIALPENSPAFQKRKAALADIQKFLKDQKYSEARTAAEELLKRDPSDAVAAAYVGRTYLLEGDYVSAERLLARAASGSANEQIQYDLRAARTLQKGEKFAVEEAQRLLRQEATAREGLQLATHVLDHNPSHAGARVAIAAYYERTGKLNLASAELTEGVGATDPSQLSPLIEFLEGFAERHDQAAGAHDLLAQALARGGELSRAESSFSRALELAEDDPALRAALKEDFAGILAAQGRVRQTRGDEREARRLFHRALDLFHNDEFRRDLSDLEYDAGLKALRSGRLREALTALDEARIYKPAAPKAGEDPRQEELVDAYESLAGRFANVGDLKGVVGARNGLYQLDTKNATRKRALADAHDAYGVELLAAGEFRLAYRQFKSAATLFSDDATYKAHRDDAWSRFN